MRGDAGQHVTEILERIDLMALAGGDEVEQHRRGGPAVDALRSGASLPQTVAAAGGRIPLRC